MADISHKTVDHSQWPGPRPELSLSDAHCIIQSDIVVVGAGHAGVQCALAAAEGGASVSVLERQSDCGHLRWKGEQIATYNSAFAASRGVGPYDLSEIYQEYFRCGAYRISPRLLSMYLRNSGEMLDHMVSLVPEDSDILSPDQCNFHQAWGQPHYPLEVGGNKTWAATLQLRGAMVDDRSRTIPMGSLSRLSEFEQLAVDRSAALGAKWYGGQEALCLYQAEGRVAGVFAKDQSGKVTLYQAKQAVCVTTGNDNDIGHRMCVWAGGHMEKPLRDAKLPPDTTRSFGMTGFVLFNCRGERYCDESNVYAVGPQTDRQPEGLLAGVFDSQWMEYLKRSGVHHTLADFGMPGYLEQTAEDMSHVAEHGAEGYGVRSIHASEREIHTLWGAQTLEELADIIGYEGESKTRFLESVARYNAMCAQGRDLDFCRDPKLLIPIDKPPYYAGKTRNVHMRHGPEMCPMGLMTDGAMAVIDDQDQPIPGLYVAGNTLGDRYCLYYPTPSGGNMIGQAMTHGRCLGKLLTGQPIQR